MLADCGNGSCMSYSPPTGWVEGTDPLEKNNVFHERAECAAVRTPESLRWADRPGRSRQCQSCVEHTALAQLGHLTKV